MAQYPQQQPNYGGPQSGAPKGRVLTILGFVFGGISILFLPIILGPAAIVCAGIAMAQGDPLAKWALAVGIGGMVLGFVLAYIVLSSRGLI